MVKKITKEDILKTIHLTNNDAAKILDVSPATLFRYKKKHDVLVGRGNSKATDRSKMTGRPRKSVDIEKKCECGNTFTCRDIKYQKKYCSEKCYFKFREHQVSDETRSLISEKAKKRWETPTKAMLDGIEKRKLSDEYKNDYKKYRNRLANLTEKTYNEFAGEINPNNYMRGLAGVDGVYHLDHIIPARFGFDNGIPPEVLAEKENLQMLPWRENIAKGKNTNEKE